MSTVVYREGGPLLLDYKPRRGATDAAEHASANLARERSALILECARLVDLADEGLERVAAITRMLGDGS